MPPLDIGALGVLVAVLSLFGQAMNAWRQSREAATQAKFRGELLEQKLRLTQEFKRDFVPVEVCTERMGRMTDKIDDVRRESLARRRDDHPRPTIVLGPQVGPQEG